MATAKTAPKAPAKKAQLPHLDGCPKQRTEKRTRQFFRKGEWWASTGERCIDCGARTTGKSRKVNND